MATLICLCVSLFQIVITHTTNSSTIIKIISSLFDSILIIPYSEDIHSFRPLLIVGWTLSFEWLFYIIFFILIASNLKQKTFGLSIIFLILVCTGLLIKPDDLRLQFITNPILLEFLLGVIIAQLYTKGTKVPTWIATTCLIIGLSSYILMIRFGYGNVWYYLDTLNGKASLNKFLIWGLPSACICFGCVFLETNGPTMRIFNNKISLLLGDASYSIYLIHYTVLSGIYLLIRKTSILVPADLMVWLQVLLGVGVALLFYKWVEKPLLRRFLYKPKSPLKKEEIQTVIPTPNPVL
jgi:exopolysaccharide production protein ExoZ